MYESTDAAPVIYVLCLVDAKGCSPTMSQLRQIIGHLRRYISNDALDERVVEAVDNAVNGGRVSRATVARGHHAFLGRAQATRATMMKGKVDTVKLFCDGLTARLDIESRGTDGDAPLDRPLMYI
jgi:hypothetical protein